MPNAVCLQVEIPEELHNMVQRFLQNHDRWDQDRLFQAALALFLIQHGLSDRYTSRLYIDTLFQSAA
jgi:hypothetical protein